MQCSATKPFKCHVLKEKLYKMCIANLIFINSLYQKHFFLYSSFVHIYKCIYISVNKVLLLQNNNRRGERIYNGHNQNLSQMAKCIRGYSIIFTNTAFVFEKKNKSSSFFQDSKILISPMRKIIFSISFQENVDRSSFETEYASSKGPCVFCCGHCFIPILFEKKCLS